MAGLPVCIALSYNVSLDFLNHMQLQFSTGSHSVFNLKVHLIFAVAYRCEATSARILKRLIEFFSEVCQHEQAELLECSGESEHVHLLISYPPKHCLSDHIRKLKMASSLKVRQEFDSEIHHLHWGKRFWTKSYYVISVGDGATTAITERYIKNQRPS